MCDKFAVYVFKLCLCVHIICDCDNKSAAWLVCNWSILFCMPLKNPSRDFCDSQKQIDPSCLCVYIIARGKLMELLMTIISFCMEILDSRNTLTVPVCSAIIWHEFYLNREAVIFGIDVFLQTHANIMSWKCLLCDWPFVRETSGHCWLHFRKGQ